MSVSISPHKQIIDLGIPISIQSTNSFTGFHLLRGLFMGFKDGKMNSVILSDEIKSELKKAPTFDAFVFTNVGILCENYKCFNKILRRFSPQYQYNQIDDLVLKGKFTFKGVDDIHYDLVSNHLRVNIVFDGIKSTMFYRIPGCRLCEAKNIDDYELPECNVDVGKIYNKGYVMFDDEYRLEFKQWFNDHLDVEDYRSSLIEDIKFKYERHQVQRKKLIKRNRLGS